MARDSEIKGNRSQERGDRDLEKSGREKTGEQKPRSGEGVKDPNGGQYIVPEKRAEPGVGRGSENDG